jgi:hypothetical protein
MNAHFRFRSGRIVQYPRHHGPTLSSAVLVTLRLPVIPRRVAENGFPAPPFSGSRCRDAPRAFFDRISPAAYRFGQGCTQQDVRRNDLRQSGRLEREV